MGTRSRSGTKTMGCGTTSGPIGSRPARAGAPPSEIQTDNVGDFSFPQVAVDPNGNAIVVWSQPDGTRNNIWANRFTPSAGWGAAEQIETDNAGDAFGPHVAVDPDGNAVAVWFQSDGTRNNIWANRFTPSAGWGAAEQIETDNAGSAFLTLRWRWTRTGTRSRSGTKTMGCGTTSGPIGSSRPHAHATPTGA